MYPSGLGHAVLGQENWEDVFADTKELHVRWLQDFHK